MSASALLKNTISIEEWMDATKETKKHVFWKKLFPAIKHSNLRGKNAFRTTTLDHSLFFMSLRFLYICQ